MPAVARLILVLLAGLPVSAVACGGGGGVAPSPEPTAPAAATARARTGELALCVDTSRVDATIESAAERIVADAIRQRTGGQVDVEIGCPPPQLTPAGPEPDSTPSLGRGRLVTEPGYYRAFVYLFPPEALQQWAGYVSNEEHVCEGDTCHSVTAGLYLRPEDLCETDRLATALEFALGLAGSEKYRPFAAPYFDAPPTFGVTPAPTPTPCY